MKKIYLLLLPLFIACHSISDKELNSALEASKENKKELLKVLSHYKDDPLKYKAAVFLIKNMKNKGSIHYPNREEIHQLKKQAIKQRFFNEKELFETEKSMKKSIFITDIQTIKSDYLIKEIDLAFNIWEKRSWSKEYSFEEFCEYVLPYRIDQEPIEHWREQYYKRYSFLLDSIYKGNDVVEAVNVVCKYLKQEDFFYTHLPNSSPETPLFLLDNRIGKCPDICNLSIYVLRALGIPVSYDFYKISPETANSHNWNVVIDPKTKKGISFYFNDNFWADRKVKIIDKRKMCKIYRLTFSNKKYDENTYVLRLPHNCKDVSDEYFTTSIKMKSPVNSPVYLGCLVREQFVPVDIAIPIENNLIFNNVEDKNIYLLATLKNKKFSCISVPFLFGNDKIEFFKENTEKINIKLTRKYPLFEWNKGRLLRVVNATIQGSNSENFIHSERLLVIDTPLVAYNKKNFTTKNQFRYIKYTAREDVPLELAELHFFNEDKKLIPKNIISGNSFYDIPEMNIKNCFDEDPLTYYLSKKEGESLILDFGKKECVTSVLYIPRNDDNYIRIGDQYELFYFSNNNQWKSLGKQKAINTCLDYEVPKGVLLFLKNHTRGIEEQIFFMKEGKQIFISDL